MSNVTRQKLGDISDSCLGKMLDKKKNKGVFHPYLANYNVRWGEFNLSNVQEMKFEAHELDRYGLEYGDLVICEGGEPGRCAIWRDNAADMKIQKALHRLRVKSGFSYDFLYYRVLLANRTGELQKYFIGSTIKHLTGVALKQVEFDFPNYEEQLSIAAVLRSLDKKIELNKRINNELEAMVKTLYDYWFVQFDFPDTDGKPYKTSGGKMVYNEGLKREIPNGWQVKELSEIATIKAGGDKPKVFSEEVTLKCSVPIYSNGVKDYGLYGYTDQAKIKEPSVTISARGTIGVSFLRMIPFVPIIRLIVVTPNDQAYLKYIDEYIKSIEFDNSGSVQRQLTAPQVSRQKIIFPYKDLLEKFVCVTSNGVSKIENIKAENSELIKLRDWLLPMLMNGQVTVK